MNQFNLEIFDRSYQYKDSAQIAGMKYEDDFLAITSNTIAIPIKNWNVKKDDYIRIIHEGGSYCGIVQKVVFDEHETKVTFNSMLKLADVRIKMPEKALSLEQWIADALNGTYSENPDDFQNIHGFRAEITSHTEGILTLEESIINLYDDVILKAFENYGIRCEFALDVQAKKLDVKVGKCTKNPKTIETDLGNVSASLTLKNTKESLNKLTVFKEDMTESISYYCQTDGIITDAPRNEKRITPVVFDVCKISFNESEKTFADAAYEEAYSRLQAEKYNHLIEVECLKEDELLNPEEMEIGQRVNIILNDVQYDTMLTGKKFDNNKITLLFGTTRTEFTKLIRKRGF